MKYTPITINKKTKTHKDKGGKEKKYIYYEAVCTVQLAKKSYRETGNGKTRQAAKDALLKKLDAEEKKNLTSVPVKSETLSDAIDHFLKYKLSEGETDRYFPDHLVSPDASPFRYLPFSGR